MSLSVGFTVFSGLDLLKPSIENIRDFADYVVVSYQKKSNTGLDCSVYMMDLLNDLYNTKLIDYMFEYSPDMDGDLSPMGVQRNNVKKRNLIREESIKKGIEYFICKDCDEFYDKSQFEYAFNFIKKHKYDSSICRLVEYKYKPIHKRKILSKTYVPFILKSSIPFDITQKMKYRVDPARRFKNRNIYLFNESDLLMHHMTQVRYDNEEINAKYGSHSWFSKDEYIREQILSLKKIDLKDFEKLENDNFNIEEYWEKEFLRYKNIQS